MFIGVDAVDGAAEELGSSPIIFSSSSSSSLSLEAPSTGVPIATSPMPSAPSPIASISCPCNLGSQSSSSGSSWSTKTRAFQSYFSRSISIARTARSTRESCSPAICRHSLSTSSYEGRGPEPELGPGFKTPTEPLETICAESRRTVSFSSRSTSVVCWLRSSGINSLSSCASDMPAVG
jgi:hypothetical protein